MVRARRCAPAGRGPREAVRASHTSSAVRDVFMSPSARRSWPSDTIGRSSVVGGGQDRLHEFVVHARCRAHRPARIGVHVPGAQLVQGRGLLVGQVQHVAAIGARRTVEHLPQNVGQVSRHADGLVLGAAHGEIHANPCFAGSGAKSSPVSSFPQGRAMPHTEFIATGFHVPERVLTNAQLSRLMDTSDEWITQRSGIKTRYWVSEGETGVTLAREATCQALANAGMKAADLDCIVYCTRTPH